MQITIKCADCGRHITTRAVTGKQKDIELEVHACYHAKIYHRAKKEKDSG